MVKHFYFFRHGETALNAEGRFQGQSCDEGLTSKGQAQAEALADELSGLNLDVIISSPLKRAFETAEIIGKRLGLPLELEPRFIEGNFGDIEGKTKEELTSDELEIFNDWIKLDPKFLDTRFCNGESKSQMQVRALSGLKHLLSLPQNNFAIVTHSSILRVLLLHFGRLQHKIPHAFVFHLIYEDGQFRLAQDDRILLLSCCAPCSCAVIEKMAQEKRHFTVAFYNPNITPFEEYEKRRLENERVCQKYGIEFISLEYDRENWKNLISGLETEPERGKRCSICFQMRLKRVMQFAQENGFTAVASVLGVSRYKNINQVNEMADLAAGSTLCPYVLIEGRKNGMQERRAELIRELDLYNQTYCGCTPR